MCKKKRSCYLCLILLLDLINGQVSDRLDAGNQTQDARVECLKRLQLYDTQIETIEEHISLLVVEFGDEILAASQVPSA